MLPDCIAVKVCSKCGYVKPATTEYFFKNKRARDKLEWTCKACRITSMVITNSNHKEEHNERARAKYHANPEPERARRKQYSKEHPEKIKAANDKFRMENPNYGAEWRATNKISIKTRAHRNYENNKEATLVKWRNREALKKSRGTHTIEDIRRQRAIQNNKCWWCLSELDDTCEVDHLIPLAKGGHNEPSNLVIACFDCNRSKGAKTPDEWIGRLL